ncbi:enoyl-CoA hydratase/isomerase family protein [Rhodococcus opacus]|uniref:enoyl-CoA hydratase/isomerase family protein n=1 Tax=Rhodococcus opacus TaxID=37919 RepID=UPI0024745DD1|nr:enoyl-CoA hydratase/isomerase family protein [Rhodococcus opacus]MDH6292228.1 enoyl-CoA hydratase/carnithine racemase [Rhodococcus opacus]
MAHLSCTIDGDLAIMCLHNPSQNRIGVEMIDEMRQALHTIEISDARAVLLRANGPDFSYGGDIELWPEWTEREMRTRFETFMWTFNQFERLPVPTVTAVQGLCFGGGFELALRSDVIFAGESARFGHSEQSIAIVTLLGGVYRVAERAGRSRAMEWAMTSEQVPAAEMERFGVVNKIVPDDELDHAATSFARKLAQGPTKAHAAHKALLRTWANGGVAAADETMFDIALPLFRTDDTRVAIPAAINALRSGAPRPAMPFQGR